MYVVVKLCGIQGQCQKLSKKTIILRSDKYWVSTFDYTTFGVRAGYEEEFLHELDLNVNFTLLHSLLVLCFTFP